MSVDNEPIDTLQDRLITLLTYSHYYEINRYEYYVNNKYFNDHLQPIRPASLTISMIQNSNIDLEKQKIMIEDIHTLAALMIEIEMIKNILYINV